MTEETRTLTVELEWQGEPMQAVLDAAALGWQDRQEDRQEAGKHMKTVEEIYREMMDRFSQETGMEPNGTGEMAVRMYALAAQVYGLYEELAWTCRQCFPQTPQGKNWKTWVSAGIARNPARQASGTLRFSVQEAVEEDLEIAQGTVCMTAGLVAFETTQAGVLPAGSYLWDLPAQAVEPGPGGNVSAGTVRTMAVAPVGVAACTNPVPFTGGREEEGDEELRARILATYQQATQRHQWSLLCPGGLGGGG
ncbi:MAG: baseplate J/gp47 family protein [Evtepia gabavorous]